MGKILLLTGRLAEAEVQKAAERLDADVLAVPVDVAQFITPRMAADKIKDTDRPYEKVILPGLVRFDAAEVEKEVRIPCFKGPRYASDIVEVIQKGVRLSKTEPADSILEKTGRERYARAAADAEKQKPRFNIGMLKIGQGFPPKIIAEIVDAPLLSEEEALARAQYYLDSGADIIDVGAIAGEDNSEKLFKIIKFLKRKLLAPVSIDSLNPKEINVGIDAGANLVLSLNSENMRAVQKWPDVAYVIIPDGNMQSLLHNMREAEKLGFAKLVIDPVLSPPFRAVESLSQYYDFRKLYKSHPMMMGVGNVVELIDADSTGVNGLIGAAAVELDMQLLLTTENSNKTRGSVRELKRAIEMSFLAKSLGTQPKDLGFNLLFAKGKTPGDRAEFAGQLVKAPDKAAKFKQDPKGNFTITVDFAKSKIIAAHVKGRCDFVFEGAGAESLCKKILESGLVSSGEHAAYLGRELQKAEMSLKFKRGYVQDDELPGL
jgi:dihydropteroate synthase-like protein